MTSEIWGSSYRRNHNTFVELIQESFGAIRTVRSFAQEEHEISRYSEKVDETLKLGLKQAVSFLIGLYYIFNIMLSLSWKCFKI